MFRSAAALVVALAIAGAAHAQAPDLYSLHDALHLTRAQEPAWQAYQTGVTPDPRAQARHRAASAMMATLPAPRRVDLINAELEAQAADVRRQGEAVKAFYAGLTPEQQAIFDKQTLAQGGQSPAGAARPSSPASRPPGQ